MTRIAVFALLALGGCVASYDEPSGGSPAAAITFYKSYNSNGAVIAGGDQRYMASGDGSCGNLTMLAEFTSLAGKEKTRNVVAGQPLTIYARKTDTMRNGAYSDTMGSCARTVSFTPMAGRNYTARHDDACELVIVDAASQTPIPDLKVLSKDICPD